MKNILNSLVKSEIFTGIPVNMIEQVFSLPCCYRKSYSGGMTIYESGAKIRFAGIIIEGKVDIVHSGHDGHDFLVERLVPGGTFGASFACSNDMNLLNEIRSYTDSTILFFNIHQFLQTDFDKTVKFLLIDNYLSSLAKSNIRLNTKLQFLSQKTLQDKLLAYFHSICLYSNTKEAEIPFNREQLACFLGSERSSVCRELAKLQSENKILLNKNKVRLLI